MAVVSVGRGHRGCWLTIPNHGDPSLDMVLHASRDFANQNFRAAVGILVSLGLRGHDLDGAADILGQNHLTIGIGTLRSLEKPRLRGLVLVLGKAHGIAIVLESDVENGLSVALR